MLFYHTDSNLKLSCSQLHKIIAMQQDHKFNIFLSKENEMQLYRGNSSCKEMSARKVT